MINRENLQTAVRQLLRNWSKTTAKIPVPISSLRVFHTAQSDGHQPVVVAQQLIETALAALAHQDSAAAELLTQRFVSGESARNVARQLAVSESQFYVLQNRALAALTNILLEKEAQATREHRLAVEFRLEGLPQQRLFGVEKVQQQLSRAVTAADASWLISVEGLGGLGKTSLADWLARQLIDSPRFFDIIWVGARQESFHPAAGVRQEAGEMEALSMETLVDSVLTQLGQLHALNRPAAEKSSLLNRLLKQAPYLIIIDNLETTADYQALIPKLRRLMNPTKFVLTSRVSLHAYSDIVCVPLTELSRADALAFVRHEAERRQLTGITQADDSQLVEIFQVVGGNPLALKLVLGQLNIFSLAQVLDNLKQAQEQKISQLYTYIYWQSWYALSDAGRQALLSLPLAGARGSTLNHLRGVTGLSEADLSQALDELKALSLVDVSGGLEERRYSIHRLTETFLLTEVTQWQ